MSTQPPDNGQATRPSELDFRDIGDAMRRRWRLLAATTAGVIALVMTVILLLPPRYEGESVLRVRSQSPAGGAAGMIESMVPLAGLALPGLGDGDVETEMGVLRTRRIVESVADSAALHVELKRPFRARRSDVLRMVRAGEDAIRGTYVLRRQSDGSYSVDARNTRAPVNTPDRARIGETFEVGNMVLALQPELADSPPREIRFQVRPFQRTSTRLRKELQVARQEGRSRLIEVSYRHSDPHIAAGVVNGIVDQYLAYSVSTEKHDSRRKVEILREQVASYAAELGEAEGRLQAFQEQARIIAPEEQANQQVRRIAAVQARHDAMEVERQALARLISQVGARAAGANAPAPYRQLATFPSFISNAAVQDVLQALTELETQRAELLARRTEQNLDVQAIQSRIRELDEQIYRLGTSYLEGLDLQIQSSSSALGRFGADLEAIPALEVELAGLVREQKLLSEVYLLLQARLRETEVQEAIDDAEVRVLDQAAIPERPVFPRRGVSLVLATVLGLMVGATTVVAREMLDVTVHSPRDARRALGAIPWIIELPAPDGRRGASAATSAPPASATSSPPLITAADPWHPVSERFHEVGTRLLGAPEPARVVVVTGATARDGVDEVAANLAIAIAQQNRTVCLLEGDLRAEGAARLFGPAGERGWVSAVADPHSLAGTARSFGVGPGSRPVDVYSGGLAREQHPSAILTAPTLDGLIGSLLERYEVVVVHTPSLEIGPDALAFTGSASATVLAARSGVTTAPAISAAAEQVTASGGHLAGLVLAASSGSWSR